MKTYEKYLISGQLLDPMEMFPFHIPSSCFPHRLPRIGSASSPEGLNQHHLLQQVHRLPLAVCRAHPRREGRERWKASTWWGELLSKSSRRLSYVRESKMLIKESFFKGWRRKSRSLLNVPLEASREERKGFNILQVSSSSCNHDNLDLFFFLFFKLRSLSERIDSFWDKYINKLFFRGGDIYKGEVSGLQGGPNAISR